MNFYIYYLFCQILFCLFLSSQKTYVASFKIRSFSSQKLLPSKVYERFQFELSSLIENPLNLEISDKPDKDSVNKARATLLFVSALYGTNFGCVKILGETFEPSVAASFRFVLAALVFLPFLLRYGFKRPVLVRGGLEVGFYAGIGYWAQAQSLLTTKASTAAFVCSLAVLVVPILDALFVESKRKNFKLVSLLPSLLATTGVACLELGGSEPPSSGDLYSFLQPLFFGLSFWRVEKFMSQDIKEPEDPKVFTGAMMLAVSIFAMIWSLHDVIFPMIRDGSSVELFLTTQLEFLKDWKFLGAILWTGIVTTALTSFGENIAMQRLSAAESTIIYSTEPLWGSAFAAIVLGEHIGVNTLFGAILILASCLWSSLGSEVIITYLLGLGTFYQNLLGEEATEVIEKLLENFSKIFGNVEDF